MTLNFPFWQNCGLESKVLIAGKSFVAFDCVFEQLEKNIRIFLIF